MEVTVGIDINQPSDTVFGYIADMSNNPHWQNGQQRCEWTSEPPLRLGSTYDQEARFLGKAIRSSFEVTEFEPGQKIRIQSTAGTMPIDVTRTVTPVNTTAGNETCRVEAIVRGGTPAIFRPLGPLLKMMVARNVRGDYQRLKELLEQRSVST